MNSTHMNIVRKMGEKRRREKVEAKRAKREARRLQKAADATQAEAARNAGAPPK
jgi:hypothetical protein